MSATPSADVVVLGAGLQGAGTALELARRGQAVMLLEQDPIGLNRASLRNEGKIHLGLLYANDPTLESAFTQLEGALSFRAIVARWLGSAAPALTRSTPFHYLVAVESVFGPERLAAHYEALEQRYHSRLAADAQLDYLGERPGSLARALAPSEISAHYAPGRFAAGFATAERAIDTEQLAVAMRAAIAGASAVTFRPGHRVRTVQRSGEGFQIEGDAGAGRWAVKARQVVNATWERRFAIDQQLGIAPPRDLLHRLKYRLIAELPAALRGGPSVTMVLGRFGDVVVRADGTAYLSWYPSGLKGWTDAIEPPESWDAPCRGEVAAELGREIAHSILAGLDAWYPGVGRSVPRLVDAGAIVALGRSDVDDAASGLHGRARIGVCSDRGWHSVDPGKLTTAPLFAVQAADRVLAFAGRSA